MVPSKLPASYLRHSCNNIHQLAELFHRIASYDHCHQPQAVLYYLTETVQFFWQFYAGSQKS